MGVTPARRRDNTKLARKTRGLTGIASTMAPAFCADFKFRDIMATLGQIRGSDSPLLGPMINEERYQLYLGKSIQGTRVTPVNLAETFTDEQE